MTTHDKIKQHFKENRKIYIGIGIGLGFAGITWAIMKNHYRSTASQFGDLAELPRSTKEQVVSSFNNISGTVIANNSGPVIFGGHTKKIIQNTRTGEIFESVGLAAEYAGVTFSKMSRHINGHMEHVNGDIYRIIGLST